MWYRWGWVCFSLLSLSACIAPNVSESNDQTPPVQHPPKQLNTQPVNNAQVVFKPSNLVMLSNTLAAQQLGAIKMGFIASEACLSAAQRVHIMQKKLIKDLKIQAYNLGANSMVLEHCSLQRRSGCQRQLNCEGVAYSASVML